MTYKVVSSSQEDLTVSIRSINGAECQARFAYDAEE